MPYSGYLLSYGPKLPPPLLVVSFAPGVPASAVPTASQWVDITSRVSTMDIRYGRTDEFSQPSAGSMELVLDNADGAMDPDNASGPYAGQLLPLVWFRARGGVTAVDTDLFYGQVSIEGWRLQASQFSDSFVSVTVLDMFEQMANTYLPSSVYAIEVAADNPRAWYRLGESSGTVATDSSGNGHHGTYEGGATFNSRGGLIAEDPDNAIEFDSLERKVVVPPSGALQGAAWSLDAWVQVPTDFAVQATIWIQERESNSYVGRVIVLVDSVGRIVAKAGDPEVQAVDNSDYRDGRTHYIAVTWDGTTLRLYVDGVQRATATPAGVITGPPVQARVGNYTGVGPEFLPRPPYEMLNESTEGLFLADDVATYDSALSAARITAHYAGGTKPWEGDRTDQRITKLLDAAGFPAPLRTIDAGASTLRPAALNKDLLSALQEVTTTERGELHIDHADGGKVRFRGRRARWTATASTTSQATFGDGGGTEVPVSAMAVEDARIVNHATVQRFNGATIPALDAASETTYQRRSHSETGLLFTTDAESQSRADLVVAEKKDRRRQVRNVTLEPRAENHPAWPEVFARRIGDRVLVRWRPPYGGTYDFASWVEGVHHSFTARGRALRTTFDLSPVHYGGAAGETTYWILGTSRLGVDTRLSY